MLRPDFQKNTLRLGPSLPIHCVETEDMSRGQSGRSRYDEDEISIAGICGWCGPQPICFWVLESVTRISVSSFPPGELTVSGTR